jgi:[acyl-carrier-protein] S-malonyltransferase
MKVGMTNSAFFLFPGQGAQYPGMALDLFEQSDQVKKLFSLAADICRLDMVDLLKNTDAETLKRTDIVQPAITLANLSASIVVQE